jgi:hypothetical protein
MISGVETKMSGKANWNNKCWVCGKGLGDLYQRNYTKWALTNKANPDLEFYLCRKHHSELLEWIEQSRPALKGKKRGVAKK